MGDEVTPAELWRWMERIERKLDAAITDHESRIRRNERALYVAIGLALASVSTSGLLSLAGS